MSVNEEKDTSSQTLTAKEDEEENHLITTFSPKLQRFVHLYMTGQYSLTKLAQLVEVHPNTITAWLKRSDVKSVILEMQESTHQVVSEQMKFMTTKALNRMRELMDSPIDGVALQAVKDVLDRTGHKAKQEITKEVNVHTFEQKLDNLIDDVIDGEWEEVE